MKKITRWINSIILFLSVMFPLVQVSAQEEMVKFNLDLSLIVEGSEPITQNEYRFDIIERNADQSAFEGAAVYKYDSTDPNQQAEIYLPAGVYTFRLYDGASEPFHREGQALSLDTALQTDEADASGQQMKPTLNQGSLNDWGNGTLVYDINFVVQPGPGLINSDTGEQEITLQLIFSTEGEDASSEETSSEESESTTIDPSDPNAPAVSEIEVPFKVVDQDGQAVEGVQITVNGQTLTTDENGEAQTGLAPGNMDIVISNLPEGYTGGGAYNPIALTEDLNGPIEFTIQKTEVTAPVIFTAVDEQGQGIAGVGIQLLDHEVMTDGQGQVRIDQVPVGQQTYTVSSQPQGYSIEPTTAEFEVLADQENTVNLNFQTEVQTGMASIQVYDQYQDPVVGLGITIAGQEYLSDNNGLIEIKDLAAQEHAYQVTTVPTGYQQPDDGIITVEAGVETDTTLNVIKDAQPGIVQLKIIDQDDQGVAQAEVLVEDQSYSSDDQGLIEIKDLSPGTYNYQLLSLPQGYQGQKSGVITVTEDQTTEEVLKVERDLATGQFTLIVKDQDGQAVEGAIVSLADKSTPTDSQGQAIFSQLTPDTYDYEIQVLPEGYEQNIGSQSIAIREGAQEERTVTVEKVPAKGQLTITALDQADQPVAGVVVKVADKLIRTDQEGQAVLKDLAPDTYTYQINQFPPKYSRKDTGQVTIPAGEDASLHIYLEKEIKPAKATLTVLDQNQEPVAGVSIQFGGLQAETNADGQIVFEELSPGVYNYTMIDVPKGYSFEASNEQAELKEEDDFQDKFQIEKLPEQGKVKVRLTDQDGKGIAGARVKLSGKESTTDKDGYVEFSAVNVGEASVEVLELPQGYQLDQKTQTITVKQDQTVDLSFTAQAPESQTSESEQETTTSSAESTTSQTSQESTEITTTTETQTIKETEVDPEQEASIESEAAQATRQFVDANSGIEVWVNPQDAKQVVKLTVDKLKTSDFASLKDYDADVYQLTLLDKNNQAVDLTKIAEVKIPTRPVNSQIKVLRLDQDQLSSLTFALQNRRVTYRTQKLGNFAVTYGNKAQASGTEESTTTEKSQNVQVDKEKSVEKKGDLPGTGEQTQTMIVILALALLLGAAYLFVRHNRSQKDDRQE
ncbi:SpaA isopeptide-forming pilin-related protein [Ignavigranum ruoffiae]|uniref:carboxypeptidase regulatory-like domain-containing protein n=1 Tax=Ignavigranum ruoffiae TaxID=89093 RepID=UPI00204AECB0|nr:carboxypeptidase regulatory-like domain-containing protein [Ignavigranum ruoffiae]UPQ85968.1 SpaA isopeptide-forming pilin-related protein [Ignavigranum ruoffiae]